MPANRDWARRNDLNPCIGLVRRLMFRPGCSTRLFRYLFCLVVMLFTGFVGIECGQRCCIGAIFFNVYHFWFTVVMDGLTKEMKCCAGIMPGGQQEIDGLPCGINGTVKVFSLPCDSDVGFVHNSKCGFPTHLFSVHLTHLALDVPSSR